MEEVTRGGATGCCLGGSLDGAGTQLSEVLFLPHLQAEPAGSRGPAATVSPAVSRRQLSRDRRAGRVPVWGTGKAAWTPPAPSREGHRLPARVGAPREGAQSWSGGSRLHNSDAAGSWQLVVGSSDSCSLRAPVLGPWLLSEGTRPQGGVGGEQPSQADGPGLEAWDLDSVTTLP